MKYFPIAALLTLLLSFQPASAELSETVDSLRQQHGLSAILIGAWEGDKALLHQASGQSMTDVPARLDMKFRAGGACLTALTCVLLQACEEGKATLDDPIDKWMPELPGANKVTLRMLANCSSGYGDYVQSEAFQTAFQENPFRSFAPEELIAYGVGEALKYEPGTDWNYSHTNFVILGQILSKIFQQPVPALLEQRVLEPLQLKHTLYTPDPSLPEPVLHAFSTERKIFEDSTFWNPSWASYSGSLASSIDDLRRLFRAIGQAQLISPKSLAEMIAPTTVGLANNQSDRFYGLGIGIVDGWLFQNPNLGGYQGVISYHPPTDRMVVVFTTLGRTSDPETHHGMALHKALLPKLFPVGQK